MSCRALEAGDYAQARLLYQALSTGHSLPDFDTGHEGFARLVDHPGTSIIGAMHGDDIVSMATLHILPNMTYHMRPYALIENVATLPDVQGQGFGRKVMQAAAQVAWDADAFKIMLLTNQARGAAPFYERLGYQRDEKFGMILRRPA